jgi:hypothetical protein
LRTATLTGLNKAAYGQCHKVYGSAALPLVAAAVATVCAAPELPVFAAAGAAGQQLSRTEV